MHSTADDLLSCQVFLSPPHPCPSPCTLFSVFCGDTSELKKFKFRTARVNVKVLMCTCVCACMHGVCACMRARARARVCVCVCVCVCVWSKRQLCCMSAADVFFLPFSSVHPLSFPGQVCVFYEGTAGDAAMDMVAVDCNVKLALRRLRIVYLHEFTRKLQVGSRESASIYA